MRAFFSRSHLVQTSLRFRKFWPLALAVLGVAWPVTSWAVAAVNAPTVVLSDDPPNPGHNEPPVITEYFILGYPGDLWTFEGTVSDESPSTVVVVFGGILEGTTVSCNEDGEFSFGTRLPAGTTGVVSAQAFDELDQASEVAEDYVE